MVRDAPTFAAVADQVLAALAGRIFVAHNARFDWGFVAAELRRSRDLALDGPRLCTVRLARRLVKGIRSCGLDSLQVHFGLENAARHRAAGDALVTAEILALLLRLAREEGARTLQDIAAIEARRDRRAPPAAGLPNRAARGLRPGRLGCDARPVVHRGKSSLSHAGGRTPAAGRRRDVRRGAVSPVEQADRAGRAAAASRSRCAASWSSTPTGRC